MYGEARLCSLYLEVVNSFVIILVCGNRHNAVFFFVALNAVVVGNVESDLLGEYMAALTWYCKKYTESLDTVITLIFPVKNIQV